MEINTVRVFRGLLTKPKVPADSEKIDLLKLNIDSFVSSELRLELLVSSFHSVKEPDEEVREWGFVSTLEPNELE